MRYQFPEGSRQGTSTSVHTEGCDFDLLTEALYAATEERCAPGTDGYTDRTAKSDGDVDHSKTRDQAKGVGAVGGMHSGMEVINSPAQKGFK